jgi:unsaturated rhamnogalacturonyl hydrolase
MKDWYNARLAEGLPTKNINTMAVLYSVASLVELDQKRGGTVLDAEEKRRFEGWMEEWSAWCMRDLPRG